MQELRRMADVLGAQPHFGLALGLVAGILAPAAALLATRTGWSLGRCLAAGATGAGLALVLAYSLNGFALVLPIRSDLVCSYAVDLSLHTARSRLDVLVYAPAACFGVLGLRRVAPVVLGLGLLSVSVESVQLLLAGSSCQASDVVRNLVGIGLGAAAAGVLTAGWWLVGGRRHDVTGPQPSAALPGPGRVSGRV